MHAAIYYLRIALSSLHMLAGSIVFIICALVLVAWLLVMAGVDWIRRTA